MTGTKIGAGALGLTFLMIGLTFAFPLRLVTLAEQEGFSKDLAMEASNVYALVAWSGWAHFLFAFQGQSRSLVKLGSKKLVSFGLLLAATIAALTGLRSLLGMTLFGAITWAYFIDHFLKAEAVFGGTSAPKGIKRWIELAQPLLSFGWLTAVLMNVNRVIDYPWLIWIVSAFLGVISLIGGGWDKLVNGDSRITLLSLFFIAESAVWGTFGRYGGPAFLMGVYVFHIAAGSYFHYFGAYFFAYRKAEGKSAWRAFATVLLVNLAVWTAGYAVAMLPVLELLRPILSIQWFTLWVATHLVASDLFPLIKRSSSS